MFLRNVGIYIYIYIYIYISLQGVISKKTVIAVSSDYSNK
jgi:hypothetical protein